MSNFMTGRTHDLFAFAALLTLATFYLKEPVTVVTVFICLVVNIVGALIPDIDQATNKLWGLLPAGELAGKFFDRLLSHRTISHSILGGVLLYKGLQLVLPLVFNASEVNVNLVIISTMIGFISHLIADSLTKEGIPLLFPFKFKFGFPPFSALRIKTDSWIEKIVIFPGLVVYLSLFIFHHQEELLTIIQGITK